jgi:aryl-alcohol dehydrogenase-like predicted oxidoreductase
MLDRLVIGTANFGCDYNGHNVSEKEQNLIMEYMKEVGIEWLDVATAYGTENVGKGEFKRIVKNDWCERGFELVENDILMVHGGYEAKTMILSENFKHSFSIDYDMPKPPNVALEYIELPYNILNRYHEKTIKDISIKFIARSIFCKGKALKHFSPRECIDFVLMNPRIDKVILGVDSVDQLRENIAHLVKMEQFKHNEEVDTRKF